MLTPQQIDSLKWRVWNTFKSVILPIVLPIVLIELQSNPNNLDVLITWGFWVKILYATLVALVGAAIAGLDKVSRMTK